MNDMTKKAYTDYIELGEQIAVLKKLQDEAKKTIKQYHTDSKQLIVEEEGFKSQIIQQTTKSLSVELIEKKFGIKIDDSCYVMKAKENFRCVKLVNG